MTSLLEGGLDNETIASATNAKPSIPLSSVSLHAPIPLPGKILAISLNYGNHIAETNSKPCVPGPHADINLPMVPDKLDDDAECCLVISKRCKHVPADRAYEVMGPWLVIRCTVSGDQRQKSNTQHFIFDCFDAIAPVTQSFTLDVGDVVRVEIEKLGYIKNTVVAENVETIIG